MGISWSGRRRNNTYLQTHPPPPPPPPPHVVSSSFYYSSEPTPLPPPSNLPLPQPQNYVFAANAPYAPSPCPPSNFGNFCQTHNPIPAYSYYPSSGYSNSYSYGNPMMVRPAYPMYYANQSNGWPAIRPPMLPSPPPPYVEHQNAKKVRNDVNVHKGTLRLEVDEHNPDLHLVSFVFDALFDGSITIFYFGKEEQNCFCARFGICIMDRCDGQRCIC